MRVLYSLDGDKSRGSPQTLLLCLTWIPILSDINRCPKYLSTEMRTSVNSLKTLNPEPSLKIQEFLTVISGYSFWLFCMEYGSCVSMLLLLERNLSSTQWAEEHLLGLNWISPLEKPLSAVGMSCKVQVKSSSQWESNSPIRDACVSPCATFILCSHICKCKNICFVWLYYIDVLHSKLAAILTMCKVLLFLIYVLYFSCF